MSSTVRYRRAPCPRPAGAPVHTVGHGIVLLPLSTAVFYTRPGIAHSHVSDISPNQVCLAWDAARRGQPIQDFAAIAADYPPVASAANRGRTAAWKAAAGKLANRNGGAR